MLRTIRELSQNWLINDNICIKIAGLYTGDNKTTLIEIGCGEGAITKHLAKLDYLKYDVIEIDERCINITKDNLLLNNLNLDNINFYNLDFLKFDFSKLKNISVVSNLPYHLSGKFLRLIIGNKNIEEVVVTLQKEVVDNIVSTKLNLLSALIKLNFEINEIYLIKKGNFRPIPKVDSKVVHLIRKKDNFDNIFIEKFTKFLKFCFSQKRKTLTNNLLISFSRDDIEKVLESISISTNVRAEDLSLNQLEQIFRAISTKDPERSI